MEAFRNIGEIPKGHAVMASQLSPEPFWFCQRHKSLGAKHGLLDVVVMEAVETKLFCYEEIRCIRSRSTTYQRNIQYHDDAVAAADIVSIVG